jgi:hypothetical protein
VRSKDWRAVGVKIVEMMEIVFYEILFLFFCLSVLVVRVHENPLMSDQLRRAGGDSHRLSRPKLQPVACSDGRGKPGLN